MELKRFLKRSRFLVAIVSGVKLIVQGYREVVWSIFRSRAIKTYLKSHQIRKLQIGAQ
jgi:hypothetical protein